MGVSLALRINVWTSGIVTWQFFDYNGYILSMDSIEFANCINDLGIRGVSNICFVIGGSIGLHKDILSKANMLLSFSDMTFPHQLMRVILLEQIYRAYRIINNEPYHK